MEKYWHIDIVLAKLHATFTPRPQLDMKAETWIEPLWNKILKFRRINKSKIKLLPIEEQLQILEQRLRREIKYAQAEKIRNEREIATYVGLEKRKSDEKNLQDLYRILYSINKPTKSKRQGYNEDRHERAIINKLKKENKIPKHHVLTKITFAPDNTPLPEFSFAAFKRHYQEQQCIIKSIKQDEYQISNTTQD